MPKQKSINDKIQESVFLDKEVDRETLKKLLVQDMRSCLVFMNEVLSLPEAIEALTNVYFDRYKKFMEQKNQTPDPADIPASLERDPGQKEMFE